jgi:WD40 repeat protein
MNPYPGLTPFEEEDVTRFFGRDREIEELLQRLASRRLLAVVGVSGCGKSSLVHAGVKPVLRTGAAMHLPARWRIATMTPANAPLDRLRNALEAPPDWPATSFDLIDYARQNLGPAESLLLIVDQFEELFRFRAETITEDGGNAASLFVNLLLNAVDQREVPIYVLLTMRTDFLGECAEFRNLPEALNDCYFLVPRMTRWQQQEAVERPLQELGVQMHAPLVQRLLNDSAEDPDHLPVLQHLLKRLWEKREERGKTGPIGLEDYEAVGGWKKAIEDDAEGVMNQFPPEGDGIRRLFQWITGRGNGEKPIRRPRPVAECVVSTGLDRDRLLDIVRAFQSRGLLRPSSNLDSALIDLTHESVMWYWPRLNRWIAEQAEQASQLRFLLQSARNKLPLTGLALSSGLEFANRWRSQPCELQRYLTAPEADEVQRWTEHSANIRKAALRRKRWKIGGILGAIVSLALSAVLVAYWQRNSAQARELSAWSAITLSDDPERAMILGLNAWAKQRAMVAGVEQSLHDAILHSLIRLTFTGHQNRVQSIVWSPDGTKLATASVDKTAKIWEAATGRELLTFRGHADYVYCIAWSPDGSKVATTSQDGTAKVWEAQTGHELLTLRGHQGPVNSIAWAPDGTMLATASSDTTARVWDSQKGHELRVLAGKGGNLYSVAWSSDGSRLATAGDDRTARIWDAQTGREIQRLFGHGDHVKSVAWSPDGSKLATGSEDQTARLWDSREGRILATLAGHSDDVLSVAWSPDGRLVATASGDNTARVWDVETGRRLLTLRGHQDDVQAIAWSPDGNRLATASSDTTAKVWEAREGSELLILRADGSPVDAVAWSPDGTRLATGGPAGTTKIWDAASGREFLALRGHSRVVTHVAWSPDATRVATASADKTAKVWDARDGHEVVTLLGHRNTLSGVVWSPDGRRVATTSDDNTTQIWDASTGAALGTLEHPDHVAGAAWSPDGRRLATAGADRAIRVWDVATGHESLTLWGHKGAVNSVAWSPDGRRLASAADDQSGRIWDLATARELLNLHGHENYVTDIAWSQDGTRLATASRDQTVKIWDARTGRELLSLRGHDAPALSVTWAPNGERLASAAADGVVQVYAISPSSLLRLARLRLTRGLTPDECRLYLYMDRCPALPVVP